MVSKEEMNRFLKAEYPQNKCIVEAFGDRSATIRHKVGFDELRPGGTVSGPVLMTVADFALYVAILSEIGLVPLAVTTSLTINFLRKPSSDKDIIGGRESNLSVGLNWYLNEKFRVMANVVKVLDVDRPGSEYDGLSPLIFALRTQWLIY